MAPAHSATALPARSACLALSAIKLARSFICLKGWSVFDGLSLTSGGRLFTTCHIESEGDSLVGYGGSGM